LSQILKRVSLQACFSVFVCIPQFLFYALFIYFWQYWSLNSEPYFSDRVLCYLLRLAYLHPQAGGITDVCYNCLAYSVRYGVLLIFFFPS
jgi:hypothetical protein